MKKIVLLGSLILFSTVMYAFAEGVLTGTIIFADPSDEFLYALQKCSNYSSSGPIKTDFGPVYVKNQILGWQPNDKCLYIGSVNYSGMSAKTTCLFSKQNINEIDYAVSTDMIEKVNLSDSEEILNSHSAKVMNKFLTDSSVCKVEF